MAVASETVIKECGRIHTAYALLYAVRPAPLPPTVALLASLLTTTSAAWVTSTKPRVHFRQPEGLAQPGVLEVEARPEVVAAGAQERDQYGGLGGNAQR